YSTRNRDHKRLRRQLGEENYTFLRQTGIPVQGVEEVNAGPAVAATLIALFGMTSTLDHLAQEIVKKDEGFLRRVLVHATASIVVNRTYGGLIEDYVLPVARATQFDNVRMTQGLGPLAANYQATLQEHHGQHRLLLTYGGSPRTELPIQKMTLNLT
ncbi:hypothetical protein COY95_02645, partial [Candidatus Woesearchaeota archaeon CG_4_10_14_0_8_um_filter_47_5]